MSLSCGLVGLPGCGKTVIFNAITAAGASSFNGSEMNKAAVSVPDQRLDRLVQMYHPRKVVPAVLEVVDIPGLKSSDSGRGSRLLAHIKNVDALLHVVRCFGDSSGSDGAPNPVRDVETLDLELVAADSKTLENKINSLVKRVRAGDKDAVRETRDCEKIHAAIQQGIPARRQGLSAQETASVRECNLVSLKPVVYIANISSMDDAGKPTVEALKRLAQDDSAEMLPICGRDEADISQLKPEERPEFLRELGLEESSMERLLRAANRRLGLVHFFTVGEDEVRAWTCHEGDKAPAAAGKIHSDMEKGFIRMEVMAYDDLMELGSEAAVARAGKQRLEGREYVVLDGDIVNVRFNTKG